METKNTSTFSNIKKLLVDLDFHHSWGYWISNRNKQYRIMIEITKNRIYLNTTKKGNCFNLKADTVIIEKKSINLDTIKSQLSQIFVL